MLRHCTNGVRGMHAFNASGVKLNPNRISDAVSEAGR